MKADVSVSQALPRSGQISSAGGQRSDGQREKVGASRFGAELQRASVNAKTPDNKRDTAGDKSTTATAPSPVVVKRSIDIASPDGRGAGSPNLDARSGDPVVAEMAVVERSEPIGDRQADDVEAGDQETEAPVSKGAAGELAAVDLRAAIMSKGQQSQTPSDGRPNTDQPADKAVMVAAEMTGPASTTTPAEPRVTTPRPGPMVIEASANGGRAVGEKIPDVGAVMQAAANVAPIATKTAVVRPAPLPPDDALGKGRQAGERGPGVGAYARGAEGLPSIGLIRATEALTDTAAAAEKHGDPSPAGEAPAGPAFVVLDAAHRSAIPHEGIAATDATPSPARATAMQVYDAVLQTDHKTGPLKALNVSLGNGDGSRVAVRLALDGDDLDVRIRANRPEAEVRMLQKQDQLVQALERHGYTVGGVSVDAMPAAAGPPSTPASFSGSGTQPQSGSQQQTSDRRAEADVAGNAAGRQDGRERDAPRDKPPGGGGNASRQRSEPGNGNRSGLYL